MQNHNCEKNGDMVVENGWKMMEYDVFLWRKSIIMIHSIKSLARTKAMRCSERLATATISFY